MICLFTSSFLGFFLLWASASGMHRGLGDKYVVRMDELVKPLDRHVKHFQKPISSLGRLVKRKVRRPSKSSASKRSADSAISDDSSSRARIRVLTKDSVGSCGSQKVAYEPPLYSTRIRNGTCTPYGAFPWTVHIQVLYKSLVKNKQLTILHMYLHTMHNAILYFCI